MVHKGKTDDDINETEHAQMIADCIATAKGVLRANGKKDNIKTFAQALSVFYKEMTWREQKLFCTALEDITHHKIESTPTLQDFKAVEHQNYLHNN